MFVAGILAFGADLNASPCVPALLSVYDAPGFTCELGPFTLTDFTYTQLAGTVAIPDTSILVTPITGPDFYAVDFSSGAFSVSGTDFTTYLLAYTWDPAPIRSLEDVLNDPVVFPALSQVTTEVCIDSAFIGPLCPTSTTTLTVFDAGIASQLTDSVSFSPSPSILGIRNTIDLQGNGASASFDSLMNKVYVTPEPGTVAAGLVALALAIGGSRFQRR